MRKAGGKLGIVRFIRPIPMSVLPPFLSHPLRGTLSPGEGLIGAAKKCYKKIGFLP